MIDPEIQNYIDTKFQQHKHKNIDSPFVDYNDLLNQPTIPAAVTDATISISDITTNDVTVSAHGWAPKAPNDTSKFLRGDATWAAPATGITRATGNTTVTLSSATSTTIAHGLGVTPRFVRVMANFGESYNNDGSAAAGSQGSYDGTTQNCLWIALNNSPSPAAIASGMDTSYIARLHRGSGLTNYLQGSAAVDSTNITITWSKTGSPTGTANLIWEAFA